MSSTPAASQPPPGAGLSSTASTVQGEPVAVNKSKDPAWKYCTCPDANKKNSLRCTFCRNVYTNGITRIKFHLAHIPNSGCNACEKVPADVREEILQYLLKKGDKKAAKVNEKKRKRSEVNLSHSEGDCSSEEDATNTSVVVLKSSRGARSKSTSGPMDKFCEVTPEEAVAARKGKFVEKIQSRLTTEKSAKRQRKNKSFDPAKWWSNHGSTAPNLRVLAMRILSLTCSSSACERNFSVFQQIHTKRRNRLLSKKLSDLVFIKFNSKLAENREMRNRDPLENTTYADVVEDEGNEWITGVVPVTPVVPIEEDEPEATSQGRASRPRRKLLPGLVCDDGMQSDGSSSESEADACDSD